MDSYNRGYGQGVKLTIGDANTGVNEGGRQLGNATIILQSDVDAGKPGVAAGFYAIAYDVSQMKDANGDPLFGTDGTVIAYRGTDGILAGDLLYGWTLGGGGVDFRPAMLTANHRAVAANDNQMGAGLDKTCPF
jgi:hypothetical protein